MISPVVFQWCSPLAIDQHGHLFKLSTVYPDESSLENADKILENKSRMVMADLRLIPSGTDASAKASQHWEKLFISSDGWNIHCQLTTSL